MKLLPPKPDDCQECAVDHDPAQPHDKMSIYYQYWFRSEHGRWPTWRDALAHCDLEIREDWEEELRHLGRWDGWEGDIPPVPDVMPTPGEVGFTSKFPGNGRIV